MKGLVNGAQTPTCLPAHPTHAKNDRHTLSDGDGTTLGDFFRVQRGIATGCNKFFILDRNTARRRGLPSPSPSPAPDSA